MTYESVCFNVCEIFAEILEVESNELYSNIRSAEDGGKLSSYVNSFDYVRVIVAVEERFKIIIDFDVYLDTIDDLVSYIIASVNAKSQN